MGRADLRNKNNAASDDGEGMVWYGMALYGMEGGVMSPRPDRSFDLIAHITLSEQTPFRDSLHPIIFQHPAASTISPTFLTKQPAAAGSIARRWKARRTAHQP